MRTSEREDKADVSQVTVEHGHMLISEAAARAAFTLPYVLSANGRDLWNVKSVQVPRRLLFSISGSSGISTFHHVIP